MQSPEPILIIIIAVIHSNLFISKPDKYPALLLKSNAGENVAGWAWMSWDF